VNWEKTLKVAEILEMKFVSCTYMLYITYCVPEAHITCCVYVMYDVIGERRKNYTSFWLGSLKERSHSEDRGVDGRMRLEWILGRMARKREVD
jgi:hypothetical protein